MVLVTSAYVPHLKKKVEFNFAKHIE